MGIQIPSFLEDNQKLISKIIKALYVDDFSGGALNTSAAFNLFSKLRDVLELAGFELHKFLTNDVDLLNLVNGIAPLQPEVSNSMSASQIENRKVLGLTWDNATDQLQVDLSPLLHDSGKEKPTKRTVLSTIAKIYDPLGLVSPVALYLKILFQDICSASKHWDEPIPECLAARWYEFLDDLINCQVFSFDRNISVNLNDDSNISLHGFSDASNLAYGAAIYVRVQNEDSVTVNLMTGKTRVAPLIKPTMPRVELLGWIMKMNVEAVNDNLKIDNCHFYTDSMISLGWIRGLDREFKQFVENRLREIRRITDVSNWHYIPGVNNISDISSRGTLPSKLRDNSYWLHGPDFLHELDVQHDRFESTLIKVDEFSEDKQPPRKGQPRVEVLSCFEVDTQGNPEDDHSNLVVDIRRFSDIKRLVRVAAYALRFVTNARKVDVHCGELTAEELMTGHI